MTKKGSLFKPTFTTRCGNSFLNLGASSGLCDLPDDIVKSTAGGKVIRTYSDTHLILKKYQLHLWVAVCNVFWMDLCFLQKLIRHWQTPCFECSRCGISTFGLCGKQVAILAAALCQSLLPPDSDDGLSARQERCV